MDMGPCPTSEVAVDRFGRVDEGARLAEAREGCGDLAPDEPRLAHAGDHRMTGARFEQIQRLGPVLDALGYELNVRHLVYG